MHKLGIIGFGGMGGGHHARSLRREDIPVTPVAAFDINPRRLEMAAERHGIKTYNDLDEFLASGEFDLVLVSTANNYHCEMTCRALEAGYNVICEKPVAMNTAELQKMIDTSEKCGKLFTVHQNRRWDRDYMMIKQAIEEDCIGKPYMIESRIHSNGAGDMYGWRGMTDHGGGMLLDWGVHMLDQILFMVNEPVKTVSANVFSLWSEEVDDYSKVILTFESGLVAQMEVATYAPIQLPRWIVYGDKGAMTMENMGDPFVKVRKIKEEAFRIDQADAFVDMKVEKRPQRRHAITEFENFDAPKKEIRGDWGEVYKNIAAVLDGKEELIVKPSQVMNCLKVIEAAFKSSKEGITVTL